MAKKRMNKKTKTIVKYTAAGIILLVEIVMIVVLVANSAKGVRDNSAVHSVLTVEAGEPFDVAQFLKDRSLTLQLSSDSKYDVSVPGNYSLQLLLSNGETAYVTLKVRDTRPPEYTVLPPLIVKRGALLKPEMLMPQEYILDATPVKVSFISSSVTTAREGHYTALLKLIDGGGNITKVSASYFVREDYNADYYYEIGDPAPSPQVLFPGATVGRWQSDNFTPSVPSFVTVFFTMYGQDYSVRYEAKDTQPPSVIVRDDLFVFETGRELPDPMTFIERIIDNTDTTVAYDQEYMFDRAEQKRINVRVTDLGGNVTTVSVTVSVIESGGSDVTPPRISGVRDLVTEPGVRPDYLAGISVYDARDGVIDVSNVVVDDSKVKYSQTSSGAGYEVTYSVTDRAGNKATATAYVRIVQSIISDSELDRFFEEIKAELGPLEGLERPEVLSRVYSLLTGKYLLAPGSAHTNPADPRKEAYWGFKLGSGDSETACAMLSSILDCLDIEWIKASRASVGSGKHSFLLVDYGFGWLYMDVMPTANYVWTTDGRLLRADSDEAKALPASSVLRREAMTDADLARLTDISNGVTVGWNYYRVSDKNLPQTAVRKTDGSYTSPSYALYYTVNNPHYGSISGQTLQNVVHGETGSPVTATAAKGYKFVEWSDGSTETTRSDRVIRELQLEARFAPDSQTFTYYEITYAAGEGGRIDGEAVQSVLYGNKTSVVTARPDDRHYFDKWSDGLSAPSRQDTVSGKATYTALFAARKVVSYAAEAGGQIEGELTQYLIPGSSGSSVRAVPDPGYLFAYWSDGGTSPERRDRVTGDTMITAFFVPDPASYTFTYTAGVGGSIEGNAVQTVPSRSATEHVRASAAEGYAFIGWSDGLTDAARSDVVYADGTVEALFDRIENLTFTVTYLAADGGSIAGESVQEVPGGTPTAPVEALPDEGWAFIGWSDGYPDALRSDAPSANVVYIALFGPAPEQPTPTETPIPTETPATETETPAGPADPV
ncbi:MAG: InlB B-repeat-containing protein [Clostridia bacterium]|nr:InlB B-repeat-containing protein [Clostridia bacterium]